MSDINEHQEINDKLDEILKIMNGNGKTGLCAKVNIMWASSLFIISILVLTTIKAFLG